MREPPCPPRPEVMSALPILGEAARQLTKHIISRSQALEAIEAAELFLAQAKRHLAIDEDRASNP